jgi:hypothetical protein
MSEITFPVPGCFTPDPALDPLDPVLIECLDLQDLRPSDLKAGGRVLIVQIYPKTATCCSGQYGSFQVLNGLGGQIHRALYLGSSASAFGTSGLASSGGPEVDVPAVDVPVNCDDKITGDDRALAIRDRGRWYVTKLGAGSSGGGGGAAVAVGVVLGGNAIQKLLTATVPALTDPVLRATYPSPDTTENEYGFLDSDFPDRRVYAYSLPETDPAGNKLSVPIVNDWRKYLLPKSYTLGTKLPRIPDGLCYVRIERPYTLSDGTSWDANDVGPPARPGVGDQGPVKAFLSDTTATVWFRHALDEGIPAGAPSGAEWDIGVALAAAATPTAVSALFDVTSASSPVVVDGWTIGIGGASINPDGSMTLTFYKFKDAFAPQVVDAADISSDNVSNLTVAVPAGALEVTLSPVAPAVVGEVVQSKAASLVVRDGVDRDVVAICLNDSGRQGFRAGDLVYVADVPIPMPDRYGMVSPDGNQTHNVFRIMGGVSGTKANITGI